MADMKAASDIKSLEARLHRLIDQHEARLREDAKRILEDAKATGVSISGGAGLDLWGSNAPRIAFESSCKEYEVLEPGRYRWLLFGIRIGDK